MFALCKPSVTVSVPLLVVPEARRLNLRRIDVGEIDRIVAGHSGNGACEGRRVVELECTGVGGTTRAEYPDYDPFGENFPLSEANLHG
jgi:hypothetical protein